MSYYETCPTCGANLDPGEICDECFPRKPIHKNHSGDVKDYQSVNQNNYQNTEVKEMGENVKTYLRFICLEDIFPGQEPLNWVLYNPQLSKERNEELIYSITKERFNITLTPDQLDELTAFDKYHSKEFIDLYRKFVHIKL